MELNILFFLFLNLLQSSPGPSNISFKTKIRNHFKVYLSFHLFSQIWPFSLDAFLDIKCIIYPVFERFVTYTIVSCVFIPNGFLSSRKWLLIAAFRREKNWKLSTGIIFTIERGLGDTRQFYFRYFFLDWSFSILVWHFADFIKSFMWTVKYGFYEWKITPSR